MNTKLLSFLVVAALGASASDVAMAKIYKTVDKEGNVVFTDVPPNDDPQAVKLEEYNTFKSTPAPDTSNTATRVRNKNEPEDDTPVETGYSSLSITSPSADEAVRENAGNLTIVVDADPGLDVDAGHMLQILIDGTIFAESSETYLTLTNLDRGTHQLTAQIVNSAGDVLVDSPSVEFHMLRYSKLMNRKPKAASN